MNAILHALNVCLSYGHIVLSKRSLFVPSSSSLDTAVLVVPVDVLDENLSLHFVRLPVDCRALASRWLTSSKMELGDYSKSISSGLSAILTTK